jgi:hypothetical protein
MQHSVFAARSLRIVLTMMAMAGLVLATPARADGLSRFEQELKPKIAAETDLTYGSASALGAGGFVLNDVRAVIKDDTPGAKPTPVRMKRLTVEDIDFDHARSDDGPHFVKLRAEGIDLADETIEWLSRYGIPKSTGDLAIDYRLDPARKVFTLNRLEVLIPGLARLELSMILDGVSPSKATSPDALDEGSLRTATLVYEDASLLGRIVPGLAAEEQKTAELFIAESLEVLGMIAPDQGPRTLAVLDAFASFIGDYKQPKGPIRITVSPPANVSNKDMDKLTVTNAIVDVFGLSASYAGTRPGAAAAAASKASPPRASAPQSAALPPAGSVSCTPGQRLFALSDGGWWPATVREATQSSGRCVVRLEGTDDDEDIVIGRDEMLAWSMDGPGTPARACRKGDRLWMKSEEGGWYPTKVKQATGANCVVVLEEDDEAEEETVELKRLRILPR